MKLKLQLTKKIENGRKTKDYIKQCWLTVSHVVDVVHRLMNCK